MSIELRILTGALAGQTQSFEKSVVAIGRHPLSDLRFDVNRDLDVSTTHGEIRGIDGRYLIYDQQSTNGTFVNRERVPAGGSRELHNGDVVAFGENGPTVGVHIVPDGDAPLDASAAHRAQPGAKHGAQAGSPGSSRAGSAPPAVASPPSASPAFTPTANRRPTTERVAIAVKQQTRWLRLGMVAVVVVLGGLAAVVYYNGRRAAAARDEEIGKLIAANDEQTKSAEARLAGMNDTALTNALRRSADSLTRALRAARGSAASAEALEKLEQRSEQQKKMSEMDMPAVRNANDPAIVLINSEIAGNAYEATGFSVNSSGLIVTNRHVVSDSTARASRVSVKFANTGRWHRAHIVKLADGNVDLALIQLDEKGLFPAVDGIGTSVDTPVGGTTLTLGFPDGTDLPMEGKGNDLVAKTTLTPGVVSKSISDLLQVNSYATHGSSGSPVFDGHGHVIGVVWGGPPPPTPIVFAVPAGQIAALIKSVK